MTPSAQSLKIIKRTKQSFSISVVIDKARKRVDHRCDVVYGELFVRNDGLTLLTLKAYPARFIAVLAVFKPFYAAPVLGPVKRRISLEASS